jgi:hypothetical protein
VNEWDSTVANDSLPLRRIRPSHLKEWASQLKTLTFTVKSMIKLEMFVTREQTFTSVCIGTDFIFYKAKWAITWGIPMFRLLSIRLGG